MIENLTYGDWALGVHQGLGDKRIPIGATIEVTRRCNNRCVHCYNNLPARDKAALSKELTTQEHCRILDQIAAAGGLWLLFTGGEIFLRDDFIDIYAYAKRKGFLVTLFTNATLITPDIADHLVKYKPFSIEVTLYGTSRDTYEKVTGVPGSFDRCMQGIHLLQERNLPLKLKTMVIEPNKDDLGEMKRYVEQELGLPFKFDALINPRCDSSLRPLQVRLSPAEVVELDLRDPARVTEWREFCERFKKRGRAGNPTDYLYRCGGGGRSFAIDPYGRMRMCVLSSDRSYDVREGNFLEGWEQFLGKLREKKATKATKCSNCSISSMCGNCPANAGLECGDPEEPVDFLCQVAHLRAYAFGIDLAAHGECEYCPGGDKYDTMMVIVDELNKLDSD